MTSTSPYRRMRRPRVNRRRLAHRLAAGLSPMQAARLEGIEDGEVASLLRCDAFCGLIEDCAALLALSGEERRARAVDAAWRILEEALERDDLKAAMFVLRESGQGRDPGTSLAQAALRLAQRVHEPVPESPTPHPGAIHPQPCQEEGQEELSLGASQRGMALAAHDIMVGEARLRPEPVTTMAPETTKPAIAGWRPPAAAPDARDSAIETAGEGEGTDDSFASLYLAQPPPLRR